MRRYETVYVVDSSLEADKIEAVGKRVAEIIAAFNGSIIEETNWGKRRLAFEIKHRQYGNYVILNYEADNQVVAELERYLKLNQNVLRYLTIYLDPKTLKKIAADDARKKREEEKALEASLMTNKNEE